MNTPTPDELVTMPRSDRTVLVTGVGYGTGPGCGVLTCGGCFNTFLLGQSHTCPVTPSTTTGQRP